MKLPEEEIKEKFYKGEISFQEAKKQLDNLIKGFERCREVRGDEHGK